MGRFSSTISAITESPVNSGLLLLILLVAASLVLLVIRFGLRIPGNHLLLFGLAVALPVMNPANLGAKAGSGGGSILSVNLSCADVLVIPAVLFIFFSLVNRNKPLRLPLIGALASYYVLAVVSLYLGSMKLGQEFIMGSHFVDLAKILTVFVYFYLIVNLIDSMDDLKVFLRTWTYTAPVVALIGIAGSLLYLLFGVSTFASGGFRASGTLGNPNLFSGYIVLSFFITSFYMLIGGKRLHGSVFMLIHVAALTLSSSKGGVVAFVTGGAVFFLLTPEYRRKIVAVLALTLLASVGTYFVSENTRPIFDRFLSLGQDVESLGQDVGQDGGSSMDKRLSLWVESLDIWEQNILFGVGKGNIHAADTDEPAVDVGRGKWKDILTDGVERSGGVSHSIYVSILCENGLIGFIVFIGIFVYFIIILLRGIFTGEPGSVGVAVRVTLLAVLLGLLAQGLVTNVEDFRGLWILLALIWLVSHRLMPIRTRTLHRDLTAESPQRLHHKEAAPA